MAASTNRSPSPMSSRPTPNPSVISSSNSRNQSQKRSARDADHRRSFSGGSPFKKPAVVPHANPWSFSCKTPANCSADFSRSISMGRENSVGSFQDDEHKENENIPTLKSSGRARSSSVPKSSKHFMCPTISAVSKVTPSPKKKVLAERKESIRTSASLSDGKFLFFTSNSMSSGEVKGKMETEEDQYRMLRKSDDEMSNVTTEDLNRERGEFSSRKEESKTPATEPKKKVRFDDDLVILSPDFALPVSGIPPNDDNATNNDKGSFQSPSLIAPLDADPAISAPYDPVTNYLSPRPQFLRYNPNPKTEVQPADSSCSSETVSGDSESTGNDETQSEVISAGPVDSSSVAVVPQAVQEPLEEKVERCDYSAQTTAEVKVEPCDNSFQEPAEVNFEPCIISAQEPTEVKLEPRKSSAQEPTEVKVKTCEDSVDSRQHVNNSPAAVKARVISSKPRFFSVSRAISLLLLLSSVAFLSVTWVNHRLDESSGLTLPPYQTLSGLYHNPRPLGEFARQSFNGLLQNARECSVHFVSYMSVVLSHTEVAKYNQLQYTNLTSLDEKYPNHLISQTRVDFLDNLPVSQDGGDFITPSGAIGDSNTILVTEESSRSRSLEYEQLAAPTSELPALVQPSECDDSKLKKSISSPSSLSPDHEQEATEHYIVTNDGLELNYVEVVEQTNSETETTHLKVEKVQETDGPAAFVHPTEPVNDFEDSLADEQTTFLIETTLLDAQQIQETEPVNDFEDSLANEQTTFLMETTQLETELMQDTNAASYLHTRGSLDDIMDHTEDTISEEAVHGEMEYDVDSNLDTGNQGVFKATVERLQFLITQIHVGVLFGVPLLAATFFIFTKYVTSKNKASSSSLKKAAFEKPKIAENSVKDELAMSTKEEHPSTNSGRIDEVVDMNGESYPSGEMSSYQKSSFSDHRNNKRAAAVEEESEVDSKEIKKSVKKHQQSGRNFNNSRRESLASSSSEFSIASASYGSFTTYSIRPRRHGDDEVVTPVRRSSRIRSKGGSP